MLKNDYLEKLLPTDLAYIAAIIDGEGCICISRHNIYFCLRLSVCMVDRAAIDFILNKFGGVICARPVTATYRLRYDWRVYAQEAGLILRLILPYLKVKKQQANIAIAFAEIKIVKDNKKTELYSKMKHLNRKGKD
jgi:hypothetical protein